MKTKIPIEVSARHIHLSKRDFEKLFGKDKNLIPIRKLSQPGEFASEQRVTLINKDKKIENVRILGPFRKDSQAEVSLTDAYNLKLSPLPKIKVSGDIADTTDILIKGPRHSIKIPCIIAKRHLHCSVGEAKKFKIKNNQNISIRITGARETTFHDIVVRVSENFGLALHLDTDEGNAAGISGKASGEIVRKSR